MPFLPARETFLPHGIADRACIRRARRKGRQIPRSPRRIREFQGERPPSGKENFELLRNSKLKNLELGRT